MKTLMAESVMNNTITKSSIKLPSDVNDIDKQINELEKLKVQQLQKQAEFEEQQKQNVEKEKIRLKNEAIEWEKKAELYKVREDIDEAMDKAKEYRKMYDSLFDDEPDPDFIPPNAAIDTEVAQPGLFERVFSHWATLLVSAVFFLICAWACLHMVESIGDRINQLNSEAMASGNNGGMLPPSISMLSYQKLWYSGLLVFCSLLVSLLIMAIIAPAQLFFILPFTNLNNTKKWKSFYEQSEYQKQWQSFAYLALILLFISMCLVK
jgi:hypothetical protein